MLDDRNELLDKGNKTTKKPMSTYEKAQRNALYFTIAKFVSIGIVVICTLWGGYSLLSIAREKLTEAVANEARNTAIKEARTNNNTTEGPAQQNITRAFTDLVKSVKTNLKEVAEDALVENGFHPDAPNQCAFKNRKSSECIDYTNLELSGRKYDWIESSLGVRCPTIFANAIELLTNNNKITYNEARIFDNECNAIIEKRDTDRLKELKTQLKEKLKRK